MTQKILLTGGAGFIGSHTADLLAERRFKVLALDDFSTGRMENLKNFRGSVEVCDITDAVRLGIVFDKFRPDSVVHLAAQSAITTAWNDPAMDQDVNIRGTLNLLILAKKYNISKFVFASTSAVYGKGSRFAASSEKSICNPDTPYGISKLAAEHYIRLLFPNHAILRYANIYGSRQKPIGENQVVARVFNHFLKGANFAVIGDGRQKRDFVYVSDAAYANYLAIATGATGTFNIASGSSHSVNDVLWRIEEHFDVIGYRWEHTDQPDERGSVYISGAKAARHMGWKPSVSLRDGIALTAEWWSGG